MKRFERFAKIQRLENSNLAIALSALLSGKALEVFARLSRNDATDYTKIKTALLKSYNLTEEGFRQKFRNSKPEENESPTQYMTRMENFLERWIDTAGASTYDDLKTLIVREQFLEGNYSYISIL